jgi:nitroimidazol reductase NimA-like FMN-containing flavoprotein (pyridoxamine 5'-phosphate oxidase superfamily)
MNIFRELRRKNQALDRQECLNILARRENGVLALLGDGDYPYAVPLNHVLLEDKIYFHCAMEGHKIDAVARGDKASYCVIDADAVDAAHASTRYRSVIAFGRVRLLQDADQKRDVLIALGDRFCPGREGMILSEIHDTLHRTAILELTIEHISGKESGALAKERRERA